MKSRTFTLLLAVAGLGFVHPLVAAPRGQVSNPDFTKGGTIPEEGKKDWNLGATGARGWIYFKNMETTEARQISITQVDAGSAADGVLQVGDVILGVGGKPFSQDARTAFGEALTLAESEKGGGKLVVTRWRGGETAEVTIELPVLGTYSATAPYDCPKSKKIMDQGCEALARRMADPSYTGNPITRSLNGVGLLASGDPKYHPILKKEADWAAGYSVDGMATWYYGYVTVFLSEYIMATGDDSVLPGLRRIAMEAAKGQSIVGSWGHKFAGPDGRLLGYGMMNSPGAVLTIGLVLAREAGVKDPEVAEAIERSAKLLRFYIGKGAVPYGDHAAWMQTHEDNGKCGMAAVLFDQLGEKDGAEFFSKMSTASHGNERDTGHTGNFFNITWAMPGVSRSGPHATGAWMKEFGSWYFDLARKWDASFPHQGPPQPRRDAYGNWDATGMYLIAYGMPRKAIRLTGSKPSVAPKLDAEAALQVVLDGRGWSNNDRNSAYDALGGDMLFERLQSWSPIVRERAAMALARRKDAPVEPIIRMLDAPALEARIGACQALEQLRGKAAPAVPKLRETLKADDMWLRVKAADALAAIGEPAMVAVPELLQMLTRGPTAADPRGMEQRYLSFALFNKRGGLLGNSLEGVDRAQLMAAVRAGLHNQDGRARGSFSSVYTNLSFEELKPLLPAIHEAIVKPAPSGIMFSDQIQTAGLELFARHRVSEGIELLGSYVKNQKPHASEKRIGTILNLLKSYGAHAQRAIPLLEEAIHYFENDEPDFPKRLSLQKAQNTRDAIAEIKAMTDKPELISLGL
ncbi:DUF6288 domain-containing protein [Haloferula sp. A504]|uniref:DUF6288 domain-containing protein n=1 Tax=Haloferula sp. A504 TaxID=3373601 RepID=UPI0031CBB333|nr:DUF6288 domain-containing protein [Verrucomicrobiaceae bacterium E54]